VTVSAFLRIAVVVVAGVAGACASAPATTARPEAFPRSRPVPNAANDGNAAGPRETRETPVTPAPRAARETASSAALPLAATPAPSAFSAAVLSTALSLLGTKYRFGGETPEGGFDCSGFVSYVLHQHSVDIPRTVAEQFVIGQAVAQDQIQPGDLVFFTTTGPGATHVGIVVNTGTRWDFVHAPADGSVVRIERFDGGYWQQRWIGARRVF
jgi:cell wall-associated NlpC family hydrolase